MSFAAKSHLHCLSREMSRRGSKFIFGSRDVCLTRLGEIVLKCVKVTWNFVHYDQTLAAFTPEAHYEHVQVAEVHVVFLDGMQFALHTRSSLLNASARMFRWRQNSLWRFHVQNLILHRPCSKNPYLKNSLKNPLTPSPMFQHSSSSTVYQAGIQPTRRP